LQIQVHLTQDSDGKDSLGTLQNSLWKQVYHILSSQTLLLKLVMEMANCLQSQQGCMTTFMSGEVIIQISQSFMALQLPHYSYLDPAQDYERAKQFFLNMFKKCSFKSKMVAISMSSTVTTDF